MKEVKIEEQETIVSIDYFKKEVIVYSTRKNVIQRLKEKLGEPNKKDEYSMTWRIPFSDKKNLSSMLSRRILVGTFRTDATD